jgi:hypothetical protein
MSTRPSLSLAFPRERSTSESITSTGSNAHASRPSWARKRRLVGQEENDSTAARNCQRPCLAFIRPSILDGKAPCFVKATSARRPRAKSGPCYVTNGWGNEQEDAAGRPSLDLSVASPMRGSEEQNTGAHRVGAEEVDSRRRPCLAFLRPSILEGKFSFTKSCTQRNKRAKSSPRWHSWGSSGQEPQLSAERPSLIITPCGDAGEEDRGSFADNSERGSECTMSDLSEISDTDTELCAA